MTKLAKLKEKQAALKAEMMEASKKAFSEITKDIFSKYPKLESFQWTQYTPYFNDGNECVFSANTDYLDYVWGGKKEEDVSASAFDSSYRDPQFKGDSAFKGCVVAIQEMFKDLDDDMLKEMFGNHCKVIAKRDSVTVEEYEHD